MTKLEILRKKVDELYNAKNSEADAWIDWGYPNHVLFVADKTEEIATRQNANVDLAVAGALLHDIADAITSRKDPEHETKSLNLASKLLQESGFSEDETIYIVNEIIKPHSCKEQMPTVLEGKAMATADGAAHFLTDFYPLFCWRHYGPQDDYKLFKNWMLNKMEKDFTKKMFFDDEKLEIQPRYEALKLVFSDISK